MINLDEDVGECLRIGFFRTPVTGLPHIVKENKLEQKRLHKTLKQIQKALFLAGHSWIIRFNLGLKAWRK